MQVEEKEIKGCFVIKPDVFGDTRGWFCETWHAKKYADLGLPNFVQDNMSFSKKGTLRGLHIQSPYQGKLVQVISGEIFDVAVDLRKGSATYGKYCCAILSSDNRHQFWIPEGFAHGFLVVSDTAIVSYKCTTFYEPENQISILWDDPDIRIVYPMTSVILSDKDANAPTLREFTERHP